MELFSNPEFVRNARSQLRTGKLLAGAAICAALSLAIGFSFSQENVQAAGPSGWGFTLLKVTIFLQALVLAAGGGIACLNSIYKEKEQNTFDYQRVTRLTPLELALGKLFGAPIFAYFIFLCLMPLAIFAAAIGRPRPLFLIAAYAVLFVASISLHALALLISLFTIRGSHTSAILLFLVLLWASAASGSNLGFFQLGPLGPFFAPYVAAETSWHAVATYEFDSQERGMFDSLFGRPVHHVPVLIVLDTILAFWFMLAVVRNIKRDPNYYEMYSPLQSLGFALFLNAVFLSFFRWRAASPIDSQAYLLTLNMVVFLCLGLAVLRNRERVRRILRTREGLGESWLDMTWPAPFLILGTAAAGLLVVAGLVKGHDPQHEWNAGLAVFRSLFFMAWLVRDIQYLQWMSLRRGKHPLVMGVLFQLIFYVCVTVFLASFRFFSDAARMPFTAFFLPSPVYLLNDAVWVSRPAIWVAAFVSQGLLTAIFIALQRQVIGQMNSRASTPTPAQAIG